MKHFIFEDNDFILLERVWEYDISRVSCHISKNSTNLAELEELFPERTVINSFTLGGDQNQNQALENDLMTETMLDYTVIKCEEKSDYYEVVFQYIPPESVFAANLDYLAAMLDIDLEE